MYEFNKFIDTKGIIIHNSCCCYCRTAAGVGISNKASQAQQLPQPVLPPGAEVKPPTKSSIASRADNTI